jgi:hypothetical protein
MPLTSSTIAVAVTSKASAKTTSRTSATRRTLSRSRRTCAPGSRQALITRTVPRQGEVDVVQSVGGDMHDLVGADRADMAGGITRPVREGNGLGAAHPGVRDRRSARRR